MMTRLTLARNRKVNPVLRQTALRQHPRQPRRMPIRTRRIQPRPRPATPHMHHTTVRQQPRTRRQRRVERIVQPKPLRRHEELQLALVPQPIVLAIQPVTHRLAHRQPQLLPRLAALHHHRAIVLPPHGHRLQALRLPPERPLRQPVLPPHPVHATRILQVDHTQRPTALTVHSDRHPPRHQLQRTQVLAHHTAMLPFIRTSPDPTALDIRPRRAYIMR